jgi:TP901 family phage tail tape measure protein
MPINASQLVALVSVQGAQQAVGDLIGVGKASDNAGDKLRSLALGGAVLAGAALVGIGVQTVKMAGDFQAGITTLKTGAGELESNLGIVSAGILKMAVDTGTSTKQLTDGMFMIESAGYHGADGLKVLQTAAEGAKVGNADLGTVAFALTGILHDYHLPATEAADAMNALTLTVQSGKMHLQDLGSSLGAVLPLAASLKISFPQVAAAIAEMTNSNTSAQLAAQHLAFTMSALSAPNSKAVKEMQLVGLTAQQVKDSLAQNGLTGALTLIEDHVNSKFPQGSVASVTALKNLLGGVVGWKTALALSGQNMTDYKQHVKDIASAMDGGTQSVVGWADVQKDFNFKLDQGRAMLETLGIKIGTALLPVLGTLYDLVAPVVQSFSDWIDKSGILQGFATGLSNDISTLSGFFKDITGSVNSCSDAFGHGNDPLSAFKDIVHSLSDILPSVGDFLSSVGDSVSRNLMPPLMSLVQNTEQAVANFTHWLDTSGAAKNTLQALAGMVDFTSGMIGTLVGWVSGLVGWLGGGGAGTDTLVGVLLILGGAFVALKIADTVAQFGNLWTKLSDGEGIIANLTSAFRSKLAGAVDDFLTKQAPAFKGMMADFKASAGDAGVAVEAVGTDAEASATTTTISTGIMKGEYQQLSLFADEAGTSVSGIGADAEASAVGVTGASATMEGDMAGVAASADGAALATKGVGVAAVSATTLMGGLMAIASGVLSVATLAFAEFMLFKGMKDAGWFPDASKTGPATPVYVQMAQQQADKVKQAIADMNRQVTFSVQTMSGNVVQSMDQMKTKSYTDTSSFSSAAVQMFQTMGDQGAKIMQTLDQNTIGYWNDIAGYISSHPINGVMNINMGQGSTYSHLSPGLQKNFFASGVQNAPPGWAIVGEDGPELMHLKGGEDIYPNGTMPSHFMPPGTQAGPAIPQGTASSIIINPPPIYLDGRLLAKGLMPYIVNGIRYSVGTRGL